MKAHLNFIGRIHSSLKRLEDCPRQEHEQAPEATIAIEKDYEEGLSHLTAGSKIILLTWLDKADRTVLKTHPRNDPKIELTGVFSTRSPDRPNPIGIHFVKIRKVLTPTQFVVENLEVLDNTPIVDIKPDL